jgi:hypothetical protein
MKHVAAAALCLASVLGLGWWVASASSDPPPDPPAVPLVEPPRHPKPRVLSPSPTGRPPAPKAKPVVSRLTARPGPKPETHEPSPLPPEIEAMLLGPPTAGGRGRSVVSGRPPAARPREGLFTTGRMGDRLRYRKGYLAGIPVHLIEADLRHPEVKVAVMVARGGIGHSEGFLSMLGRARPTAAITGTFFGIRNHLPTGDIVVNRRNLFRGFIGTALAVTDGNVVSFITTEYREAPNWHLFDTVIRTGPRLLDARQLVVAPEEEGFTSLRRHVARSRTAVGITAHSRLLLLTVKRPVSLYRLGLLMQALGAYHAAALDGGTSTAMSFGGRVIASPGRPLTNLLLVYARRDRYERAKQHLVPPRRGAPIVLGETPTETTPEEAADADSLEEGFSAKRDVILPATLPDLPFPADSIEDGEPAVEMPSRGVPSGSGD